MPPGSRSKGTVITVGTFDGVHLGHRAILDRVRDIASPDDLRVVFPFEHPPRLTLSSDPTTGLLLPIDLRRSLLQATVDRVVLAPFAEMRDLPPEVFVRRELVDGLRASSVVVGEGFRFGRDRSGDVARLATLGEGLGFSVHPVPAVLIDGEPVSSTRIRMLLRTRHAREAAALLGRPSVLMGSIIEEKPIPDRRVNLEIDPLVLLPADGVYLVGTFVEGEAAHALLYVGHTSTLESDPRRVEMRLLEPTPQKLNALTLEVQLLERLRDDRPSGTPEGDRDPIDRDTEAAASLIERHPPTFKPIRG